MKNDVFINQPDYVNLLNPDDQYTANKSVFLSVMIDNALRLNVSFHSNLYNLI